MATTHLQIYLIDRTSESQKQEARDFRQRHFFDPKKMEDPYRWTLHQKDHLHWLLYEHEKLIGYAHVQIWPAHRAALRIIVIDENVRGRGMGKYLMMHCERALKGQDIKLLQIEAAPDAYHFYKKLGYVDMPFNNPEGELTHPLDSPLGKYL